MDDAEGMPEDDVTVGDIFIRVGGNPFWEAPGRVTRGLGHVSAGGVDLCVIVWKGKKRLVREVDIESARRRW